MAASRNRQQTNRRQTTYRKNEAERRNTYIYDDTARELDVRRAMEEAPKKKLSHTARKNREKRLSQLEAQIEKQEEQIAELENAMFEAGGDYVLLEELTAQKEEEEQKVAMLYEELNELYEEEAGGDA